MKKINVAFLLLFFSVLATAQVITYDTIRVSPDDERNIHRNQYSNDRNPVNRSSESYRNVLGTGYDLDVKKLRYGLDFGLYFSKNYSSFSFGPQMGYMVNDQLLVGAGTKYYYYKTRVYQYEEEVVYKNNMLGINAFGYFYPSTYTAVFVQPEINHMWSYRKDEVSGDERRNSGFVPSFLVGGGLRFGLTHITLNYDLARHRNSPYSRGLFFRFSIFL